MDRLEDGSIHESGFNGFIIETRAEQPKRGVLFVFTMKGGTIKQALESCNGRLRNVTCHGDLVGRQRC